MKTIDNKIDTLIDKIDSEFIKLWDCAENNLEYDYFDFFMAMDQLVELLKRGKLTENYKGKLEEYYHMMVELFQQEEKVVYVEYIDKDDDQFRVTVKWKTFQRHVGLYEETTTRSYREEVYNTAFKNFNIDDLNKDINKSAIRSNLYFVLKGKCRCEYENKDIATQIKELPLIDNVYKISLHDEVMKLNGYTLPLNRSTTFSSYVAKLKKQKENLGLSDDERNKDRGDESSKSINKSPGRPRSEQVKFEELLKNIHHPQRFAEDLKRILGGKRTKDFAAVALAMEKNNFIDLEDINKVWLSMTDYFGDSVGVYPGFHSYLNKNNNIDFKESSLVDDYSKALIELNKKVD